MQNRHTLYYVIPAGVMLVVIAFAVGLLLGRSSILNSNQTAQLAEYGIDSAYLEELLQEVKDNYLSDVPGGEDLTYGMAKGLVESLGDEYSAFLDPEQAKEYMDLSDSAYEGIGVQLGFNGQYTSVTTPIAGYPGEVAGMLAGDLIIEVDGEDVTGQRPEIVATKIRGEKGTKVKIKVYRESTAGVIDFEIERAAINLENIEYEQLDNGLVKIHIIKFTEGADGVSSGVQVFNRNWDRIVNEVVKLNPKGIVLDLRNNPGGYVESVKYVAEDFLLTDQVIMREQYGSGRENVYSSSRDGRLAKVPMVVLVNEGSASASEIFAGAMQDNSRAPIVGKPTVGKGVEQQLKRFDDGAMLLLVFKRWLTPDGVQISPESPIQPDVEIEFNPEVSEDLQLDKAVELLRSDD